MYLCLKYADNSISGPLNITFDSVPRLLWGCRRHSCSLVAICRWSPPMRQLACRKSLKISKLDSRGSCMSFTSTDLFAGETSSIRLNSLAVSSFSLSFSPLYEQFCLLKWFLLSYPSFLQFCILRKYPFPSFSPYNLQAVKSWSKLNRFKGIKLPVWLRD